MDSSSRSELRARIRQQEVVTELGQQALESDDLDQLMHDATAAVAETLGNDYCGVLELLSDGNEGFLRAGVGWREESVGNTTVPTDSDSQAGYTLRSGEPIIVDDLGTESRFSGPDLLVDHDVKSGISVVIGSVEDPWGVLGTHATERRAFTEHDANFVRNVANVLASAIENERVHDELEEMYGRISDAFFALDGEWRFTHLNERARELINPEGRTLIGECIWEAFPESVDRRFKPKYERAMYEQETVSFEEYYPEPLDAWFEVRAYPSETGLSVYFRDVTDRKERERELEQIERRFDAIFEDPNILVGLLEPDGTVLDINGTAMEYIDAGLEAVTGEPFWETPWWGEGDEVQSDVKAWTKRAAAGEYVDFEIDLTRSDGQRYTLNGVFRPVTNDDGDVVSIVVSDRDVTERKDRERQLEESERRYRTLVEHFPNGVVALVDEELRYQTVGGDPMIIANVSADEVEGRAVAEAAPPQLAEELLPRYEAAFEGETSSFEAESNGRTFQFRIVPVRDDDGDVFAALGMSQDITERTKAQRHLEESERRYRTLAEYFPNGIVTLFDHDLRYELAAGRGFAEIPVEPADVEGNRVSEVWGEGIAAELRPAFQAALQGEERSIELEYAGREWILHAVPITDEHGDVFAGMTMAQDITERKEHQRRLERYKRYTDDVLNAVDDVFYVVDSSGDLRRWNESVCEVTGYSDAEIESMNTLDFFGEDDREVISAAIAEGFERGSVLVEATVRTKNGEAVPYEFSAAALEDPNGNPVLAGIGRDITARKEREQELAKYETIVETINDGIYVKDTEGRFTMVNDAYTEITGYEREELLGEHVSLVADADVIERARELQTREADGEVANPTMEATLQRADGTTVPTEGTFATLQTDGEPRWIGVVRDITDREEQRRRIEESERRYRTLAEHFPNGAVGVYDRDLRYTLAAGSLLGDHLPSADRLEGDRLPEIFPQYTVEDLEPLFRAAVEDGVTDSTTTEFGGRHWQVWATPLRDANGEIFAGLSFAQDITEQIERERELERALDLLERTETIADVGGWEIDMDARDVFWTDQVFELLDVDAETEPSLEEALEMYHEEDKPILTDAVETAFDSGEPFDVEARVRTNSGRLRWLRLQGVPETDGGEVVSLRGAAQDVTERKRREKRLEELIEKLETSNERLEQFAYAASHDLQEPLRMISSYLQLIEDRYGDELDADGEEFLEFAVDGADRMRSMIDGLLEYSRVETRGDSFEPVPLDAVLADVCEDLRVRIEESGAEIDVNPLPRVDGDAGQLRQVFQNLLDNAVEYSGDDEPRIQISAERDADEWIISVSDEGIGIDPDDANRIFEVFQSLHSPEEHSGTGIGLALVERIVERHGGDIWVDSEPGEGATFSFTLPAAGTRGE